VIMTVITLLSPSSAAIFISSTIIHLLLFLFSALTLVGASDGKLYVFQDHFNVRRGKVLHPPPSKAWY
jgi:hypothetical protein